MVTTIKIFKKTKESPNSFGCINKKWNPEQYVATFAGRPFVEIREGEVLDKETHQPISAAEIVKELVNQNRLTVENRAQGRFTKQQFNSKWIVDYHPDLESLFAELNLPIPEDKKSYGERIKDQMLGNLQMQGLIQTGLGTTDGGAAGVKAIYEAKLKAEQEELAKIRLEKERLESELKALEELRATKEEPVKEATKSTKKKEEVAV